MYLLLFFQLVHKFPPWFWIVHNLMKCLHHNDKSKDCGSLESPQPLGAQSLTWLWYFSVLWESTLFSICLCMDCALLINAGYTMTRLITHIEIWFTFELKSIVLKFITQYSNIFVSGQIDPDYTLHTQLQCVWLQTSQGTLSCHIYSKMCCHGSDIAQRRLMERKEYTAIVKWFYWTQT